jgi:hypothetical protein
VGTAAAVFVVGILLMFCSSMGLLGLLRRSWRILALLVVILVALLFALFAIITICFVLGYRMPSLRDIVADTWQTGCADPGVDTEGCLQAELVANNWCFDHGGLPVPALGGEGFMFEKGDVDENCALPPDYVATDDAVQRMHQCSVSCQTAMVATFEHSMGWIAIGCYIAFFTLVFVVMWNSQTHHGLWCISPSENEDDDENTVMAIPPMMAYVAYFLNGCLGIAGIALAVVAGAMLSSPTSYSAAFAIFLGVYYFICAAVACGAVAKNLHWLLRICNIMYFVSCLPLLVLSLIAAVYSGRIENVYDTYDDNWCKVRQEIDGLQPNYCKVGNTRLSDAACKSKIVEDTAANLRIVGYACGFALLAVALLIWFSMRLARKFKFDGREGFDESQFGSDVPDVDDKGGDDEDPTMDDEEDKPNPVQMGLLAAPFVIALIATGLVFGLGGDGLTESPECSRRGVSADFNGTSIYGQARFTQPAEEDGVAVDIEYHADDTIYANQNVNDAITTYEIHEFPVPEDGDCESLGDVYPSPAAGIYREALGPPTGTPPAWAGITGPAVEMLVETTEVEELWYDGEKPEPVMAGDLPAVQLFGENSIAGRSVLLKGPGLCIPRSDADPAPTGCDAVTLDPDDAATSRTACENVPDCFYVPPKAACGTITQPKEKTTSANFTDASGFLDGKIRGTFTFSQVTTRGSVSDTVIYIELEATADWDGTPKDVACTDGASCPDGTPIENGCASDDGDFVSCGHKAHVHSTHLSSTGIASARAAGAATWEQEQGVVCGAAGGHFNLINGIESVIVDADACGACADTDYECKQSACETGDITGMFGTLDIGKPGSPSKYVFVVKYDPRHSLMLGSTGQSGADVMTGRAVVLHAADGGGTRMACADIPSAFTVISSNAGR